MARLYPHLLPGEIEIWERFLAKFPDMFDSFAYDVHVGEAEVLYPGEPKYQKLAEALLKRRIDVVATRNGEKSIIEIKPDAGATALGQVLFYKALYEREYEERISRLIIVSNRIDADSRYVYRLHGVEFYEV